MQSSNSSARWYAGAGIYRNVWLISTDRIHVPVNGVTVTTPLDKVKPEVTDGYTEIKDPTAAGVENVYERCLQQGKYRCGRNF